jgi:hypothetical protein
MKRILKFNLIAISLCILLFSVHSYLIEAFETKVAFSLLSVYLFFGISSIVIITVLELLFKYLPSSTGYAFLVSVFLKMGLFILLFFAGSLSDIALNKVDKISILIPLFSFMSLETLAVVSRLKGVLTLGATKDIKKK